MVKHLFHSIFFAIVSLVFINGCSLLPTPPVAYKQPYKLIANGDTRIDPYFWLSYRDSQKVLDYLLKENTYTEEVMEATSQLQDKLIMEFKSRKRNDDVSVPVYMNGYYYYTRFEEGKDYPINCRKKTSMNNVEEIILDENEVAAGYRYCLVASIDISPDNRYLAFGLDTSGSRLFTIMFKDLQTGRFLDTRINNSAGVVAWAKDSRTVFYSQKDKKLRPSKIFRCSIFSPENKVNIFEEKDSTFSVQVFPSKSGDYIFIASNSGTSSEYRFLDAENPYQKCKLVQARVEGLEYSVEHAGNGFYILTNWQADNFRIMKANIDKPDMNHWTELIPHRPNVLIISMDPYKNYLVVTERKDALLKVNVVNLLDSSQQYIDFGEDVYTALPSVNPEFNSDKFQYYYTSLTTPGTTYEYNFQTHKKQLLKQVEVVGNFDPNNYVTQRLWATASDSTKIPISIVYRKGIKFNGKNPTLMYGYGAYGYSINPNFDSNLLSLLDRGFIYAIAHVRGGQELGRQWYEAGKLLNKKNTFTDFIACTEYLIKEHYTSPKYLVAQGGSAGGLLMGVVANRRPDLYKAIIAEVPFVDVLTTMQNPNLPLTTGEYDEWGNPKDSVYYYYIKSYSPYDNVKPQQYPNMLVLASYNDTQVQYFEAAKWVAKLRATKTDGNLLLLKTDMETGHGGASGRMNILKEQAFKYAFMFKVLGISN